MFEKNKNVDHVSYEVTFDKYKVVQNDIPTAIKLLDKKVGFKDSDKITISKVNIKVTKEPKTLTYAEAKKKYYK